MTRFALLLSAAAFALSAVPSFAQPDVPTAPVSGWLFNGALSDEFGGNHGTALGDGIAYSSNAPFAGTQALDLRGINGAANFGNPANLQLTSAITVSTWLNFETSGGYIFGKWDIDTSVLRSWAIRDAGNGILSVMLSRNGYFSTGNRKDYRYRTALNDGNWHHIAFTFENDDLRLYLNGTPITNPNRIENDSFTTIYNNSAPVVAGSRSDHPNSLFDGMIGETAIWDRALTANEILWLSQNSLAAIPEPSTYAALVGLGILGFALARRRRKS